MTDKVQKIREEVERLKLCTMDEHMKFYSEAAEAEYNALCNIEHFIDSLPEEPISEDLEKAAMKAFAKAFFVSPQWTNVGIELFKAGAKWQKEQMMKSAVEGEIIKISPNDHLRAVSDVLPLKDESEWGTRVKLIIIKEEQL